MTYRLGIDIGGTFTDLVLLEEETGTLFFGKTLTTYDNPANGIIKGTVELLDREDIALKQVRNIVHGTTLVTNAVIERRGAKTGLITTKGFEDVLEIGREYRYDIYDIFITVPEPLVPRNLRVGVSERVDYLGNILTPLDLDEVATQVEQLVAAGCQSVAVCFLQSFTNPAHERAVGDFIRQKYPQLYVSLSVDVMPEIREYERTSATVMNAYVQPITDQYLSNLRNRLHDLGFAGTIEIMISSGRLTSLDGARQNPVQLLESGPAGGTMAGVFYGKLTKVHDLLAFDMGGTTAKASLIFNLKPEITNQFEAARVRRFKKGSGLPVRIPVIDMIEIGAGGGSIAYIDHLGLLRVGPESAASEPGPACYGRGGTRPTVTDTDLVLGYLNPDYFLGGTMQLNVEAARQAIDEHIAKPLSISIEEAAMGVHRIVNENMANAARVHILEKGHDPRRYSMTAFGGAGPVHAFGVARLLGSPQLIVPVGSGVLSALGFLVSPVASERIRSYVCSVNMIDWVLLNQYMAAMEVEGLTFLKSAGLDITDGSPRDGSPRDGSPRDGSPRYITISRVADMRYSGQGHEISVDIPSGILSQDSMLEIEENFKKEYHLRYGKLIEDIGIEAVTWRVVVSGPVPQVTPSQSVPRSQNSEHALKGYRQLILMGDSTASNVPVYSRYQLESNDIFDGPAIIEEMESTFVVGANATVRIDEYRNIVVEMH